jgi:hypothetical protein
MRGQRRKRSLGRELAKGAVAGAVATAAMDIATRLLREHEAPKTKRREQRAGGGMAVEAAARPTPARALHWALGIGAGAVYAALRPRFGGFDLGRGLGFGTGFWLVVDETVTPLLGLSGNPAAFPWQAHVRGFAGHLIFGTVTDSTLDVLDRVL